MGLSGGFPCEAEVQKESTRIGSYLFTKEFV